MDFKKQQKRIYKKIKNWYDFFRLNEKYLRQKICIIAQGGTIDAIKNENNKLIPSPHPITIKKTYNQTSDKIVSLFTKYQTSLRKLSELFPWSLTQSNSNKIPWLDLQLSKVSRISSYDSSQEVISHFLATLIYIQNLLLNHEVVIITQGTDSLINKSALFTAILSPYLYASKKKIIFVGSPESGYVENSLAIPNISAAIYISTEKDLPGGVYIISTFRKNSLTVTEILAGLGAVKLHADGYFHSPNSGSILNIERNTIYKTDLYDDLTHRIKNLDLIPYLSKFYLKDNVYKRLEQIFKLTHTETVDNDPKLLLAHYKFGKRVFIVRARGSGNASDDWRKSLMQIVKKDDVTVCIITVADSGDVNLKKYAAGLDIDGVLSGRTLREEAAIVLSVIAHDLKIHENYNNRDLQQLIERYCYLSGLVSE